MDYHLGRKIRLKNETEHESLYKWCLEEIDTEGRKVGGDQIPWKWSFHFTISELRLMQGFGFGELSIFDDEENECESNETKEINIEDSEMILAKLHPGTCNDGKWLEGDSTFSMFGTNRAISEFSLRIYRIEDGEKERCSIWGGVSYTSEVDFRDETSPDSIEILLVLSESRFNRLARLISRKEIDIAYLSLSRLSGLYSEWSPSISTSRVKVLARGKEQEIIMPDGCDIDPPRLGDVGKFDLSLVTRCNLNPKQDLTTLNISKLFDDEDHYEEEVREDNDLNRFLLAKVLKNQEKNANLKIPLWAIVFLLGALLFTVWL